MNAIRDIEWQSCLLDRSPGSDVEREIREEARHVPDGIAYFAAVPWVARAAATLNNRILTRSHLEHDLADLIGLVVSQDASCRYCFAETRALLLMLGYSPRRISELEHGLITTDFPPRQRAAMEFARRLAHANPPPLPGDVEPLRRSGFSEMEIKAIVAQTVLNVLFNRVSTLAALPPEPMERLPHRWYAKLGAPLLRRALRRLRRTAPEAFLSDAQRVGPYEHAVVALDGLPLAAELRTTIDAMWESNVLSRRSKALAFAVIARALGDDASQRESLRLAKAEGFTDDDFESALAHLASPRLDPVEALVVPFVRETIWYQVPLMQRRARQLREQLSPEQFLETITVAAVANALCRVSALFAPK